MSTCAYCRSRDLHLLLLESSVPRRLGVAGEHPRAVVCHGKFVPVRFHRRKERNQASEGGKELKETPAGEELKKTPKESDLRGYTHGPIHSGDLCLVLSGLLISSDPRPPQRRVGSARNRTSEKQIRCHLLYFTAFVCLCVFVSWYTGLQGARRSVDASSARFAELAYIGRVRY